MTTDASLETLRAYWRQQIGFDPDVTQGVIIARPQGTLRTYHGIYLFRRGYGCIISPPEQWRALLQVSLRGHTPDAAFDVRALRLILGDDAESIAGPTWVGCADDTDVARVAPRGARLLEDRDRPALLELRRITSARDWDEGAVDPDRSPIFGVFEDETLLAAASYEPWGDRISAIGVVTHPLHRRRGCGTVVAAAAMAHGLARKQVMLWQTLEFNSPSMAIARNLGFQPYARTIAVRLRPKAHRR